MDSDDEMDFTKEIEAVLSEPSSTEDDGAAEMIILLKNLTIMASTHVVDRKGTEVAKTMNRMFYMLMNIIFEDIKMDLKKDRSEYDILFSSCDNGVGDIKNAQKLAFVANMISNMKINLASDRAHNNHRPAPPTR